MVLFSLFRRQTERFGRWAEDAQNVASLGATRGLSTASRSISTLRGDVMKVIVQRRRVVSC